MFVRSQQSKVNHRQGSNRVIRGGGWNNDAGNCRAANRNRNTPTNRNNDLGFRLAASSFQLTG